MSYGQTIARYIHIKYNIPNNLPKVDVLNHRNHYFLKFCSHFNLGRTTNHNMIKIEPYLRLRRLFSAFLVMLFASKCYRFFFCYVCVFSGRKYEDGNVFPVLSFGLDSHSIHNLS